MLTAKIDVATSGDQAVVAAVTGKRIRVVAYVLVGGGAVNVKWRSNTTDLSGAMTLASGTVIPGAPMPILPSGMLGHVETAAGEALNLNLSGNVQVSGHLTYVLAN